MARRKLEIEIIADDSSSHRAFARVGRDSDTLGSRVRRGAGIAAAALGGTLLAATAAAAYGIKKTAEAAEESNKVHAQTAAVLKSTGHAANVSQRDVEDLAGAIMRKSGIDDEVIQSGANVLLTFRNLRNEVGAGNNVFDQATVTVTDMSVALGKDLSSTAIQVGKALNDPIKGITALGRAGVQFTDQQKEQITTLVESGNTLGAQKMILRELRAEFAGSAAAQATGLEKLHTAFGNVEESVGNVFLPLIEQGADTLTNDFVPELQHTADSLAKIAGRKDIDLGKKLGLAGDVIKRDWGQLPGQIGDVVDVAIPVVAARSGKLGVAIAEGTIHGFAESDVLGKIVIGLGATKLVGGPLGAFQLGRSVLGGGLADETAAGFKSRLPIALAAVGVANIATSVASGDMRDAGFELGGALAGGVIGAFVGGPAGAALGASLGTVGGELGADLFGSLMDSEKQLTPLQARLRAEARHAAAALSGQKDAVRELTRAQQEASQADQRHKGTTDAVREAQQRKNHAIRQFGADSKQARQAEQELATAQHRDARTAQEAADAHKLSGLELKLYKHRTVETVDAERNRIPGLKTIVRHLQAQYSQDKGNYGLLERLIDKKHQLARVEKQVNDLVGEAAKVVNPKWAASLKERDAVQRNFGKHYQGLLDQIPEFGKRSASATLQAKASWNSFSDALHLQTRKAKTDVRTWGTATTTATGEVRTDLNESLSALGVKEVFWGPVNRKQRGGTIGGRGTGDKMPALLEPGEYVLNRNATATVGTTVLDDLNFRMAPRFQKGGPIGSEPRLTGTQPLRGAGQHAIHDVYTAAVRYYNRHAQPPRIHHVLQAAIAGASRGYPYVYGGGHASFAGPFDCSGYVSYGLHAGNFIDTPMSVQQGSGLYTFGAAGPGKWLTWGVRGTSGANAHTMFSVRERANRWRFFESGGSLGGGGGAREVSGWDGNFQFRHIPGFQRGGQVLPAKARDAIARYGQEAFDPRSEHFVGWGFQKGGMVVKGRVSYFGGGATAGGSNTAKPGVALNLRPGTESGWNNATTRKWRDASLAGHPVYARVTIAGKTGNLPITDMGPSGSTRRAIDVTEGGVRKIGFSLDPGSSNFFPTDATGTAVILGQSTADAKKRREERRAAIKAATVGPGVAIDAPPPKATPLDPAAKGLSPTIKSLLTEPGIGYADKVGISDLALSQAEDTAGTADDEAVLDFQQSLFEGRRRQLKRRLKAILEQLAKTRDPTRQKKLLGQAKHLREELGSVQSSLSGVRSAREGLQEGEAGEDPAVKAAEEAKQAAEEMAAAAKALKESIDQHNAIMSSELAINASEAKRAMVDVIRGELGPIAYRGDLAVGAGFPGSAGNS